MGSYTITITPDDDRTMTTTLRLDVADGTALITDLHLHANGGLSAGQLPAIDFGLLLRAVSAESTTPVVGQATSNGARPAADDFDEGEDASHAKRVPVKRSPAKRSSGTARRTRPARAAESSGERAYRRMPDDFIEVFQRLGGASAAADYYEVPRHTANSWLRRLRQLGLMPS